MTTRRRRKWGSGPSAPALIAWVGGTGIGADRVASDAWSGVPASAAPSSYGRAPLFGRARGFAAGTLLACGSVLAVTVHAADSSSQLPESAHPGLVTASPDAGPGGYGAKPLTVAALSAAVPAATSAQAFAGTGTGAVHRNRPIAFGVAGESSSEGAETVPLARPDSGDGQGTKSGPVKDAVEAPARSAVAGAVGRLAAPADKVVSPVPSFGGQAVSTASDVVALTEEVLVPLGHLVAPVGEGTQPAMTMLSRPSYS